VAGRRAVTATETRPLRGSTLPDPALRRAGIVVPACYLVAALVVTWRLWADPASRFAAPNAGDADLFSWYLRYAATAVSHGRLPALVTSAMNAPVGVNLMWNTSLLLPGVLLTPVTLLLGPQVSLAVLTTAGFAGSAWALFRVLRRWQLSTAAAAQAGAVYGFSPALLHSAIGHYNLLLAILPPLIADAGVRLAAGPLYPAGQELHGRAARGRPGRVPVPVPVRTGAWLGLLVAGQLLISEEVVLLTALAGVLAVIALAAARPAAAVRRILPAAAGLVVVGAVTLALAGPALWTQFRGPLVQHGPLYPPDYYVNEPWGFVTPSSYLFFHTAGSAAAAAGYHGGLTEYLAYLGWPLIIVLALAAAVSWRRPAGLAAAFTLAGLVIFSFGGHPQTGGIPDPAVSLPWHWFEEHQLLSSILPDRLSILADGAAAVLLAIGIDESAGRLAARRRPSGRDRPASAGQVPAVVLGVAALAILPLLPRPLPAGTTTPLPDGWSTTFAALHLPAGAPVLVVPVPTNILTAAMRWQADTGQPSAVVGGYFIGPGAGGQAYIGGNGVSPAAWYLDRLWAAGLPPTSAFAGAALAAGLPVATSAGPASAGKAPELSQVRADLAAWHPAAVVAVTAASSPLASYLVQLLGPPTIQSGTVIAWRR